MRLLLFSLFAIPANARNVVFTKESPLFATWSNELANEMVSISMEDCETCIFKIEYSSLYCEQHSSNGRFCADVPKFAINGDIFNMTDPSTCFEREATNYNFVDFLYRCVWHVDGDHIEIQSNATFDINKIFALAISGEEWINKDETTYFLPPYFNVLEKQFSVYTIITAFTIPPARITLKEQRGYDVYYGVGKIAGKKSQRLFQSFLGAADFYFYGSSFTIVPREQLIFSVKYQSGLDFSKSVPILLPTYMSNFGYPYDLDESNMFDSIHPELCYTYNFIVPEITCQYNVTAVEDGELSVSAIIRTDDNDVTQNITMPNLESGQVGTLQFNELAVTFCKNKPETKRQGFVLYLGDMHATDFPKTTQKLPSVTVLATISKEEPIIVLTQASFALIQAEFELVYLL